MNKNKGVIGIGLVLAIVLGIAVVGGGAYYLGNSNVKKEVINPVVNVEESLPAEEDKIIENMSVDNEVKNVVKEVTLDMSSELARTYKTAFTNALKQPASFNGHYSIASWGCGSGCLNYGIVDKLTGKVYQAPGDDYGNTAGYSGDADFDKTRWSVNSNLFKAISRTSIDTFKFENEKFTKIKSEPFPIKNDNLIKLSNCGVSLSKTSEWSVISNTGNEVVLDILSTDHTLGTSGINIKCVLSNTITDTDAKFGNITYFYDAGKKAWMETDNKEGEGITPNSIPVLAVPLFTVDGLPIFRGTGRWLTYIVPISPSSILYLHEGDTEGGYTQTLTNLVKTLKKL